MNDRRIKYSTNRATKKIIQNPQTVPDVLTSQRRARCVRELPSRHVPYSQVHGATCRESPSILSSAFSFSPRSSVAARLPASLFFPRLSRRGRCCTMEGAEREGEEPVVNQNRRSSESPSHFSESVQ